MDMDAFVADYARTALWSSTDENGEPLGELYTPAPATLAIFRQECTDFLALLEDEGVTITDLDPGQVAHDFWLTRNRHGAGFWDRGLNERGDALTKWAHSFGCADLYVGDDELIYQS